MSSKTQKDKKMHTTQLHPFYKNINTINVIFYFIYLLN